MKRLNKRGWKLLCMMAIVAIAASGCASTGMSASARAYGDDLYGSHDINAMRAQELAQREAYLNAREAELSRREYEQACYATAQTESYNEYENVLSSGYDDSYEMRLRGFNSATYNMPSAGTSTAASTKIRYASAYDPAYYNVIVMGDEVWVEPKYVSSMFGYVGRTNIHLNLGLWGFGWNHYNYYHPWSLYNYPYSNWYGWNSPFYYNDWYWGGWNHYYPSHYYGYYGYGGYGYGYGHRPDYRYYNRNTIYGRPRTSSSYRPTYGSTGYGSSYSGGSTYRRGSSSGISSSPVTRPGGTTYGSPGNTTYRRSSSSGSSSSVSPGTTTRPSPTSPSQTNSGVNNGTYRRNNNSSSSSYTPSTSSPSRNNSSTPNNNNSYRRSSSSSTPSSPSSSSSSSGSYSRSSSSSGGGSVSRSSGGGGGSSSGGGGGGYRR